MKYLKIMIGYSDATAILLGIYSQTGIPPFYGPALVPSFGEHEPYLDYTYKYFSKMLLEEQQVPFQVPIPPYWSDEPLNWEVKEREKEQRKNKWICVNEGTAKGRLIGGNLNTMVDFWGSKYMPDLEKGGILKVIYHHYILTLHSAIEQKT